MDKSEILSRLAELVGIEPVYWDVFGRRNETSEDTKRLMMAAIGLQANTPDSAAGCLRSLEEQSWRRWLPPVTVVRRGQPLVVPLSLPADMASSRQISWRFTIESGYTLNGWLLQNSLVNGESRIIDGQEVIRLYMTLPEGVTDGYHTLTLEEKDIVVRGMVIIAPAASYLPLWFTAGERHWGVACHLYALRSKKDWGIGDFTTLSQLAAAMNGTGATCIGINPLHALFPNNPLHCSPYSPSSRLFLNSLYIDVSVVPELTECSSAQKHIGTAKFQKQLEQVRASSLVDYYAVAKIKHEVLELLHACFESKHPANSAMDDRRRDFEFFCSEWGESLYLFALYQTLLDTYAGRGWHDWPELFQNPNSAETRAFALEEANARRISYHLYLQWEADRQLGAAMRCCIDHGLTVGLYRDLAVGVDQAGADVWSNKETFVSAQHIGAPPDQFNVRGQDWGSPPFNPLLMKENRYSDFIAVLRANMRYAGALRIDHVMALMHLFWIPLGGNPSTGAYMGYPFDDLLGIVALESHRQQCMVVGEDLGTVPIEFRNRMIAEGILSYRVLAFERWPEENLFKRPGAYPLIALATASTHDLPTIAGHWRGSDIAIKQQLNLISSDQPAETLIQNRCIDRELLRAALIDQGLLGKEFPIEPELDEERLQILVLAVHRFLAKSASRLMLVNLDDLLLETTQLNLPGTVDEYPNWRRKLSQQVESMRDNTYLYTSIVAINTDRNNLPAQP